MLKHAQIQARVGSWARFEVATEGAGLLLILEGDGHARHTNTWATNRKIKLELVATERSASLGVQIFPLGGSVS